MDQEFKDALKRLNDEQRQAVKAIEGPVLVVAGPGTGKTQILSLRVANILKLTDTDPGAILCLTFTNFAATNMRERLLKLIGPAARNVRVNTFHSFAADIMSLYPEYFWQGARLTIAPDTVQLDILQSILAELPLKNPLASKFAGQYTALPDVQQALRLSKEAGLTPAKLAAMITVNTEYIDIIEPELAEILSTALSIKKLPDILTAVEALPDQPIDSRITPLLSLGTLLKESLLQAVTEDLPIGKTTQTGAWKRRWIQTVNGEKGMFDERRRNEWWAAFAGVYAMYRQRLHERGYYDYSDMIVEVITQLEQKPELRAAVQEKFLYILIDEFQDTNAAQMRLSHLVATHHGNEQAPNLMAVGDDDQAIFAFNGAELSNMLAFRRTYPTTKLIVLTKNYRSHQSILDTAQAIIEQADERLVKREPGLTKHLEAVSDAPAGTIRHDQYPTREHEFTTLAQSIEALRRSGEAGSIAVLSRKHDSLREISSLLNKLQVPIRYEQQNDVLQEEVVRQIILIAEAVQAVRVGSKAAANATLAALLRHPMWKIPPPTLWRLVTANYSNGDWLGSMLAHSDVRIAEIANWLSWLANEAERETLQVMLEYFIGLREGEHRRSPLRDYYLGLRTVDNSYLLGLSGVNILLGLVAEFSADGNADLSDFVRFIGLNRELGRNVVDQSWFTSGKDAVQLMTVFKAKGLEFDTVILLDAVEGDWQPRKIGRKPPANLPLQPYGEEYDDYIRLLYVAATRAKSSFIASSYAKDTQGKEILATPLLATAIPPQAVATENLGEPIDVLEAAIGWPRLEQTTEKAILQDRLDRFALSATALCRFLDVTAGGPQSFLASSLLGVPGAYSPQQAYGIAMHSALQAAQRMTRQKHFTLDQVKLAFHDSLEKQVIPAQDKQRYDHFGQEILDKLFTELNYKLPANGRAEVSIGPLEAGEARIRGTLDHMFEVDGELIITDYKTGTPVQNFATKDKSKQLKVWRHRTQLTFYALLAKYDRQPAAITTRIAYVEAEQPRQLLLSFKPSDEELAELEKLIQVIWRRIMNLDFPDTSGYSADITGVEQFIADLLKESN